MIPKEIIEEIRNKSDIVKVISEYVQLRKRGKNYLGLCPFHSEKDPSFTVSPEKQFFHCFGCNEGGNAFAFIMKMENIGFAEAVEELGAKIGVVVPKATRSGPTKNLKDKLYKIMEIASKYYQDSVNDTVRTYLTKRKITEATRKTFQLGYAPQGWDNLFKHLVSRGVDPKLIEKTGLILARENKSGYYDRFRNRLIFSIMDQRGRTVAFGGRALGDEEPKYLNSPDTAIYHKGGTLFGLNLSKNYIKQSKTAIMVEGNFDLITPYQAGITNIVATMGTALTAQQCKLLARYCDTVIVAYDADSAGGIAAERSVELLRNQGLRVAVASLAGAKDPDELIINQGLETFKECLDTALPFVEFKIKRILLRHNIAEIESKARALREVAAILSQEQDSFIQKEYAKVAADLLRTDIDTILTEIKRKSQYPGTSRTYLARKIPEKPAAKTAQAERNIIALASQNLEALNQIKTQLTIEDFLLPETKAIAALIFSWEFEAGQNLAHVLMENLADENAKKFLSRLLVSDHLSQEDKVDEILNDCLAVIKKTRQKNKIESIKLAIKEAEKSGKTDEVAKLLFALKSEIS